MINYNSVIRKRKIYQNIKKFNNTIFIIILLITIFLIINSIIIKQQENLLNENIDNLDILIKPFIQFDDINKTPIYINAETCHIKEEEFVFDKVLIQDNNVESFAKTAIYSNNEIIFLKDRPKVIINNIKNSLE